VLHDQVGRLWTLQDFITLAAPYDQTGQFISRAESDIKIIHNVLEHALRYARARDKSDERD
jgi:hypothetical protein